MKLLNERSKIWRYTKCRASIFALKTGVNIIVDGALFKDVHSLSLDYIKGAPMLFACVSDVGGEKREQWNQCPLPN